MPLQCEAEAPSTNTGTQTQWDGEQAILERIAQRDTVALSELYDRYAAQVYAMALAGTSDPTLAEKATEETFVQVWSEPERFRFSYIPLSKWLMAMALRRARKAKRVCHLSF